jgi:hypothetical protein
LFVIGLAALGIMFLSWQILPPTVERRALVAAQAHAIVEEQPMTERPEAFVGSGIYLGLMASTIIALFGLTIVVRRAAAVYSIPESDDDV